MMPELRQGSELREDKEFIVLVCDIDDITQRAKENNQVLSDSESKQVYELARNKLTDLLMNDFWEGIDVVLDELKKSS